jgi:hypothetical protein
VSPATDILVVTLLRLAKGAVSACEIWYCQTTGKRVPAAWQHQRTASALAEALLAPEESSKVRQQE